MVIVTNIPLPYTIKKAIVGFSWDSRSSWISFWEPLFHCTLCWCFIVKYTYGIYRWKVYASSKVRDGNLRCAIFRKILGKLQANMFTLYTVVCLKMIFDQNGFFFGKCRKLLFFFPSVIFSILAIYIQFYQRCLIVFWFIFQEAWKEFGLSMTLVNKYAIKGQSTSFKKVFFERAYLLVSISYFCHQWNSLWAHE